MNEQVTSDAVSAAVRNTCILATVRLSRLGISRTDKQATDKVLTDAAAVTGAARVVVSRLPGADHHHRIISGIQTEMRNALNRYSMPYGADAGWRLLPNANWDRLLVEMSAAKDRFNAAVRAFQDDLPNVLAQARTNKGSLNVDLPTEEELRDAYHMESEFRPINAGRFSGLPEPVIRTLERHAQDRLLAAVEMAKQDTFQRFLDPLERFVERMEAFDKREEAIARGEDVGKHGIFRDSCVANVQELVDVVGSFNITGDERMAALAERAKGLDVKPDALRDSKDVRQEATAKARALLDDIKSWL